MLGSVIPIVPTSTQEKGGNLMGQDRGCRPGDPISPIPGDECALLCPLLCWVLHYRPRTKPLDSRALVGPFFKRLRGDIDLVCRRIPENVSSKCILCLVGNYSALEKSA
ncbi:hypothetical protein AVEN_147964-1 [Araneus ventricosus]|uniref:Uncharacterized protein n=1 Tax=Araneus ventricosus TaxID=182803 RepID=A0A4Y2DA74_ARAVE|nr:hypothetical protein AVEN_147964-1 [Araneus ventricosus]